jgi:PhzF family phenazine biosynthesis protein
VTKLAFTQVDAFADRPFTGNPAAVIPLDAWLPDDVLQAIAMENNLAETAFTIPASDDADYELRWFTPTVEVALCGHATLASGHVLMRDGPVRFRTRKAGILEVRRDGDGYHMSLPAYCAEPRPLPRTVAALGCAPEATLWHEGRYGIVVVKDEDAVRDIKPDFAALAADPDVITAIVTAPGRASDVVSRVFVPGAGIDEDPVTGAAHAVLTPYWADRLGRSQFSAFQASSRGGHLSCQLAGDRAVLGGRCVTVIEGVLQI